MPNVSRDILSFAETIYRGKTIYRYYLDKLVKEASSGLEREVVDLASGGRASYHEFIPKKIKLVRTNRTLIKDVDMVIDLNEPLPFQDASIDNIFLLNAIYILDNRLDTLKDIRRVLKKGGSFVMSSPFISNEMPEPHDYVRLTKEGLEREMKLSGFNDFTIVSFGDRFTSAAYLIHPFLIFNTIRFFVYAFALLMDKLIPKSIRTLHPAPLGYFIVAKNE